MGDVHCVRTFISCWRVETSLFGVRAQEVFQRIYDLITQSTGQSGSAIAHFWRSRLLVTLAKITSQTNIMLIDVSLRELGRDGKSVAIDFSIVTPAAESYCKEAAKTPLHAAGFREVLSRR